MREARARFHALTVEQQTIVESLLDPRLANGWVPTEDEILAAIDEIAAMPTSPSAADDEGPADSPPTETSDPLAGPKAAGPTWISGPRRPDEI
jgi:hypothetical protein